MDASGFFSNLDSVINDPRFQSGMGLLGAGQGVNSPMLQAYILLNQQKQQQQKALQAQQQIEVQKAQAGNLSAQTELHKQQAEMEGQKLKQVQQGYEAALPFLKQLQSAYGVGGPAAAPAAAPDASQPSMFTTSANPGGVEAERLNNDITALQREISLVSRAPDAATRLPILQSELGKAQNRLAQLKSAPAPQPGQPAAPPAQQQQGLEPWRLAELGAATSQIATGQFGPGFQALAQGLKPQIAQPGQLMLGPGGQMTALPNNPLDIAKLELERQKLSGENANRQSQIEKRNQEMTIANQKQTMQKATDYGQVRSVVDSASEMNKAIDELQNNPALTRITSRWSALPDVLRTQIDPQAANAKAELDSLGSKILLSTITALKALSQNGSTGFGQLSNIEGEHLINSITSLKQSQTHEQIQKNLNLVRLNQNRVMDRAMDVYEKTHGEGVYPGLPKGTRPAIDPKTGARQLSRNGLPLLSAPDGKLYEERQ